MPEDLYSHEIAALLHTADRLRAYDPTTVEGMAGAEETAADLWRRAHEVVERWGCELVAYSLVAMINVNVRDVLPADPSHDLETVLKTGLDLADLLIERNSLVRSWLTRALTEPHIPATPSDPGEAFNLVLGLVVVVLTTHLEAGGMSRLPRKKQPAQVHKRPTGRRRRRR